ncbi:MAG TPA: hypothetical protein VKB80_09620 [Kofleriaceae bacterium]|nr:hypothetical protein [Kofleriaceae bacterium]
MFARISISLALSAAIAAHGASPALAQAQPAPGAAPASAAASAAATTDRAAGETARLQRARVQKLAEKRMLERTYETQLRDLDRLKRSRASWNRDRQIRSSKAESQTTAERLSRADLELRGIDALLRRQRQSLVAAIDRELAARPAAARRGVLDRMRAQVTAALQPSVRKILVPDDTLDEMADPEELAEQIALIQQAEVDLRRERESLRQREDRYARMARLRDLRERASQMDELDDGPGRRTGHGEARTSPGAASGGGGQSSSDQDAPPEGGGEGTGGDSTAGGGDSGGGGGGDFGSGGSTGGGGTGTSSGGGGVGEDSGFEQSSILLTDVVDSSTIDALRRAGRSSSPRARADAAARARRQVEARLQRLERSRSLIQRHLGKLRQGQ